MEGAKWDVKTAREMEHQCTCHVRREAAQPLRHVLGKAPAAALMLCVRLYRCTLSPAKIFLFGPLGGCRFEPSCSAYALDALRLHGARAGSWLALKRIARCHPWGACGHDPVPPKKSEGRGATAEQPNEKRGRLGLRGVLRPTRPTLRMHPQQH